MTPTPTPAENIFLYWRWLKDADIPNFVIFLFTAIAWPLTLWLWSKRKVSSIPNLEIRLASKERKIDNIPCPGVEMTFVNKTGSVVYISNGRLLGSTSRFKIHKLAAKDISAGSYELKFLDSGTKTLHLRQVILQTDQSTETWMALETGPGEDLFSYDPPQWRKILNRPRYFRLEFLAVVGENRIRVSLPY